MFDEGCGQRRCGCVSVADDDEREAAHQSLLVFLTDGGQPRGRQDGAAARPGPRRDKDAADFEQIIGAPVVVKYPSLSQ